MSHSRVSPPPIVRPKSPFTNALISKTEQVIKVRLQAKDNIGRFKGNLDCALQTLRLQGVGFRV